MNVDGKAVRAWVAGVLAGVYKPEPQEEIWEWAERTLRIPETENAEMAGQLWSSRNSPYVRELMAWFKAPGKGEFWTVKASQIGLTMTCLIMTCWMIVHRPGNIGYALDSIGEARRISKVRLKRWIEKNRLLDEIGEPDESLTNLTYYLKGTTVYLMGGNSAGEMANKTLVAFFLDEYDKHGLVEGSTTAGHARERCKVPKNAKIVGLSSPGDADEITKEYLKGTQEEVRFPFPCCGHEQALHFKNMVFGTAEFRDLAGDFIKEKVLTDTYFKCEFCGGRLYDHQKMKAMETCHNVATNPKPVPGVRSQRIWDAYSKFVTFGQLALEWIEAQGDEIKLKRFFRGRLGEQYLRDGRSLTEKMILDCRAGHMRGTVPFRPKLLCQATDIQGDVQKSVKVAFDDKWNAWVVDWFVTMVLEEAADWAYEDVQGPGGELLKVSHGLIDEGHRQQDVLRLCMRHLPVFWPVKGRANVQVRNAISTSLRVIDGEQILAYHIAEDEFKWQLLKMISDRERRKGKGEPVVFFPADVETDMDFVAEFLSERPVEEKDKWGRSHWKWHKNDTPNDFWDCVKYCLALGAIMRPVLDGPSGG